MIITEKVEIKVSRKNVNKIREILNNNEIKINDIVFILTKNLSEGSHFKVKCKCDICGNIKEIAYQKYIKNINNGGYYACSSKCAIGKVKQTSLKKFGEEFYMKTKEYAESAKKTNNDRYDSDYFLTSDIAKEKIKETNLIKYGVENPFANKTIIKKIKETNLIKYGVENPSKSDVIKNKISVKSKETWDLKYKNLYKKHNLNVINYINGNYEIICQKGHVYNISKFLLANRIIAKTVTCLICNPIKNGRSGYEIQLCEYIKSIYNGDIIYNDRNIIFPLEIDIYLPDLKIAFEFNGLYYHSDLYKKNDYHYNKHKKCKEIGVELIQVWEDNWLYKNEIIKSIIQNKLNIKSSVIYARKCDVIFVDNQSANNFLEKNHLKGKCNSKYNIALIYENQIISMMTFGSLRVSLGNKIKNNNIFELHRYCNLLNTNIIGGASKMFSFFKKNIKYSEIISYYDKSLGFSNFYEKIGLYFIGETPIDYSYIVDGIRQHRYKFRKQNLIKMGYDPNKTENEITKEMGILKIYGAGNYKYSTNSF